MNERVKKGKKIGIIGVGNLGTAILRGLLAVERATTSREIFIHDEKEDRQKAFENEPRVEICRSNKEVVKKSGVIILAVKPVDLSSVLKAIAPVMDEERVLLSVAAGVPTRTLEKYLGAGRKVIRVMPNIGARVGESVTALCRGAYAGEDDEKLAKEILRAIGTVYTVNERDMDAITGLSGSGIAFFAAVIDALTEGGVYAGLPRGLSEEISARTALGAAKMVLAGDSPSQIKQMTASPGGTTMRGLYAMEAWGVKAALMEAVIEATERARELSEQSAPENEK
jgi:pyrroline-5-carboxylate reductase